MLYIKVNWPEIQDYMTREDYNENVFFDPRNNCWFVPSSWDEDEFLAERDEEAYERERDYFYDVYLEGLGGDWEG